MAKLSVIIPSRDERFLIPTIHDVFKNSVGEIEIIAVLDSDKWPEGWKKVTDQYPNLHTIHNGKSIGMRGSINKGVASAISRGAKIIVKCDGHVSVDEGFDEKLKQDLDDDWIVIPRRKRLDAENWTLTETNKPDIDYHYLSFPDDPNDWGGAGLNGKVWEQRARERFGKPEYDIDDECSSQGSFWCMKADYFQRMGFMDEASYGPFWNEMQELALCCWLSGGQVKVNKKTWYAHLHKGKKYGRGYHLPEAWLQKGRNHTMLWPWNEAFPKQTLPFKWLIERFPDMPGWPDNWEEVLYATRKPKDVPRVVVNLPVPQETADQMKQELMESITGLRIHRAHYGIGGLDDIDVRERLQNLAFLNKDSLDIVVNNSTLTPGQNPFRGKKKRLLVRYSFDGGEVVEIARDEKDWLIIGPVGQQSPDLKIHTSDPVILDTTPCSVTVEYPYEPRRQEPIRMIPKPGFPPRSATALNDYLIRRFSISPQRLRGPMPIELRDFHRNDLAQLFAELGFKRGAEIGVAEGNYSEVLLKANPECELLLVDLWHAYSDNPQNKSEEKHTYAWTETLRKTKPYKNVLIMQDYSMNAVREIKDNSLDFCYIDAMHSYPYVMCDIIEWTKRVRSGGIVALDDIYKLNEKWGAGPMEAIYDYTRAMRINPWWLINAHKSVDAFFVKP